MSSVNDSKEDNYSQPGLPDGIRKQLDLLIASTVYVDPDGDLTLLVGNGARKATFCVSSKVMRLTSPVWRAMLRIDYGMCILEPVQSHTLNL